MIPHEQIPSVTGIASSLPAFKITTEEMCELVSHRFELRGRAADRLLPMVRNCEVEARYFIRPVSWMFGAPGLAERNEVGLEGATELGVDAARRALGRAGLTAGDVAAVVVVCSTVIAMPGLDTWIANDLGLPADVLRVPVYGRGCAGGAAGLGIAAHLAKGCAGPVLLVVTEACSCSSVPTDRSLVALSTYGLYGDGAVAVVVDGRPGAADGDHQARMARRAHRGGPAVLATHRALVADTEVMGGWGLADDGVHYRHDSVITKLAATHVPQVVDGLCERAGIDRATLRRAALHPSSGAAIRSQCDALGLDDHSLDVNLDELRRHGNTSGPSVLMALEALLETTPSSGEPLLVLGSGPGYCIESVLLSW